MNNNELSLRLMLQDLLLNQMLTKRELARTVRMSIYKINEILLTTGSDFSIKQEQAQKIAKLYLRLKAYEDRIEEYIVALKPFCHYKFKNK